MSENYVTKRGELNLPMWLGDYVLMYSRVLAGSWACGVCLTPVRGSAGRGPGDRATEGRTGAW